MPSSHCTRTPWRKPGRHWLGYGVTVVAAVASMATSYGGDFTRLSLPEQAVSLDAEQPEYRSRFRVESYSGKFNLSFEWSTTTDAMPTLDVQMQPSAGNQTSRVIDRYFHHDDYTVTGYLTVEIDCPEDSPCDIDFELIAASDVPPAESINERVKGTLSISASPSNPHLSTPGGTYLAIEPLP